MAPPTLRCLFLADTHLGIDTPARPRVERRRRGDDFLANYHRALDFAALENVDFVVHGGDLLYRSRVGAGLALQALAPLQKLADSGIPVFLVPGNHERARIPFPLLTAYPGMHIFDAPRTFVLRKDGFTAAVSGFPFVRHDVRGRFPALLEETRWRETGADVRILCIHQAVEGAVVGPSDYTFRSGPDVVATADIPAGFAAVLSGHVHRHQVLERGITQRPLAAPVLYPGSTERTSFAEAAEAKGFLAVDFALDGTGRAAWRFHELPARPMVRLDADATGLTPDGLESRLRGLLSALEPESVVSLTVRGAPDPACLPLLTSRWVRSLAPDEMNVDLRPELSGPREDASC